MEDVGNVWFDGCVFVVVVVCVGIEIVFDIGVIVVCFLLFVIVEV